MLTLTGIKVREAKREKRSAKKMSFDKIESKISKAFKKLNNKSCYDFLDDEKSSTRQNLEDFLSLIEKWLEKRLGKYKVYSKKDVLDCLMEIFPEPTDTQFKTLKVLNKHVKKNADAYKHVYSITGLFPGKDPEAAYNARAYDMEDSNY